MTESVVELRQYTLHPDRREGFIARFEREFVDTQEVAGIAVVGIFRDLDDPDRFVWLRAFPSYEARSVALATFYDGPVWAALRDETNADLIDSDDVLMLRSAPGQPALPPGAPGSITVWSVTSDDDETTLLRSLTGADGALRSHPGANNFPRQPIRDDRVVVTFGGEGDGRAPRQRLRLAPTDRSPLR